MTTETTITHTDVDIMASLVPNPMLPKLYRVQSISQETVDTWTLEIEPLDGDLCPRFLPGQFNMLYVFGVGEMAISISGDPSWRGSYIHTVRAVGAGSKALCSLKSGDTLGVRGPFGTAWPGVELLGRDVVLVAGGIGLAPLRPTIYSILTDRDSYGRVSLLYGARTPHDLLYTDELSRWRDRPDLNLGVTVDTAERGWFGNVGVVTTVIPRIQFDPDNAVAVICGPEIMMRFTIMELQKRGLTSENIYVSMERNMKCGVGLCGHCQLGPAFVCKDGPVFRFDRLDGIFGKREL
ncbi:MAG: FAD/NAD(P)-binding protein [Chloroflexota bacterium]